MNMASLGSRFFSLASIVILAVEANASDEMATGAISLKMTRPFETTQNVSMAKFTISNGLHNAITFFEVGADGFGYDVENCEKGKWKGSGVTWCATGRKLNALETGGRYDFEVRCEPKQERQRVTLEYWVGEPLVTVPLTVVSEPFVLMPVDYDVEILCAVQTNVVSADSIKTNGVVKIDSPVVFPPMRGEPLLIRSSCPTPSGLGRLEGVFPRDFINARFNERVSEAGLSVSTDVEFTNECYIVTRDLIRPYHECRQADLYYDKKSGKLYSVRYSVKLNGFPMTQEYLRIAREIAKDLGFWYRLQFTKEIELDGPAIGSVGENGVVLRYRSKDETFPICIEVRNVKGRLQIDVSITNAEVLGRVRPKTVSVDNQIEVDI